MVVVLIGIVGLFGAREAWRAYQNEKPAPVWVPIPVNPESPIEKQEAAMEDLKVKLKEPAVLIGVVEDLGLRQTWGLSSDEDAVRELERRMFVRTGTIDTRMGPAPAIHVGVNGKLKERSDSERISVRLVEDVWPILGIEPPKRR